MCCLVPLSKIEVCSCCFNSSFWRGPYFWMALMVQHSSMGEAALAQQQVFADFSSSKWWCNTKLQYIQCFQYSALLMDVNWTYQKVNIRGSNFQVSYLQPPSIPCAQHTITCNKMVSLAHTSKPSAVQPCIYSIHDIAEGRDTWGNRQYYTFWLFPYVLPLLCDFRGRWIFELKRRNPDFEWHFIEHGLEILELRVVCSFITMNTNTAVHFDSVQHTPTCCGKHSLAQMCIDLQPNIATNKCSISSCLSNICGKAVPSCWWVAHLKRWTRCLWLVFKDVFSQTT